jgi:hypothetical protein
VTIASLIVDVAANTVKLTKDVEGINSSLDKIGDVAKKAGAYIASAFSIGAVTAAVDKFIQFTGVLTDMSLKTGIGTDQLQKLKYAAEQNGGSLEQVTAGIAKMGKALVEGDSSTVGAMKRLGLSLDDVRNMDPATAFTTIADAIAAVPNPLERSKLAMDLFGKSGAELLPMMTGNLTETMKAAERLGIIIDTKTVAAGDNLGDTLTTLQGVGTGVIGKVLAPMLPAIQMVADWMTKAGSAVDFLRNMFDGLLRASLLAQKGIIDAAISVAELGQKVPGLSRVMGDNSTVMRAMRDQSTWLAGAIKGVEQGSQDATVATKALTPPVVGLTDAQKKAAEAAAAHAKAIGSIRDNLFGNGAIKASQDYVQAIGPLANIHKMTEAAQADVNKVMAAAIEVYAAEGKVAPQAVRDLYIETLKLAPAVYGLGVYMRGFGEEVKLQIPALETWNLKVVDGWKGVEALGTKVDLVPPKVKKTTDTVGELAKSLAQLAQISGGAFGDMVRNLSSVVGALDAAKKAQAAFSDGLKTFQGGDLLGGIAGMASGILGIASAAIAGAKAVGGLLKDIFGLGTAGRDAVKDFAASFGGFDDLHAKLLTLGAAGEALWIKLTQGVGRNNPEQAKAVIEEINKALAGQDAWMGRLPGLIEKYGLSWEQAGQQAKQAKLDEIARGLIQDFADLSKAGFDVTTITQGMSGAINDYVQQAMRTGTEVPAAMKPLLEKMVDLGLLTDSAGNKMDDLSGLTFATTLTEGFKSVVDAIGELTRALTGGLGGALDELGRKRVVIPVEFDVDDVPDYGSPATAATGGIVGFGKILPFGRGGMVPFRAMGTDTVPAMLTPGEIVLNAAQQRSLAGSMGDHGLGRELAGLRRDMRDMAAQAAFDRALITQTLPKALRAAVQRVA